ncbi:MAG: LysR family transcriptional regulator [Bdellovibrionaceae bacterium]|nr:LysR family transcriptional regulator [Bdellovibrionales bacterium]MCB9085246.1 LysR family transcriptional regulator [Pseudobdellovibrionaceae bacterium]
MNWLNYHHLMYFRSIATEGSISRASEKLMVGQPALSAQLKQLEEFFDQKLFERRNRQLILTDAGKATLKYANQIHSLGRELLEVLSSKSHSIRPHITIGSLDSVPKNLVVNIMQSARRFQDCHVTALDGTGDELYRQLISHSVDVVVSNHLVIPADDKSVFSRSIARFKIGVYGAKKFIHLKKGFPASLKNQPMILPTLHSKLRHDIDHFFTSKKISVQVLSEAQDTTVQKLLACDGAGLIAEPEFAVKSMIDEHKLFKLGYLSGVYEEFFLSSTKRVVENPVVNYLMEDYSLRRPKGEYFE